ncbi:MAG: ETC complex I subunit [Rhodospirillales bacterium]
MAMVRIFQPAKTAMQSGRGNTRRWLVEHEASSARTTDPVMGWVGSADTSTQLRMYFPTKDEAIAYADRKGLTYRVIEPKQRKIKPKSYAANFL